MDKKTARLRRAKKTRAKIKELKVTRLTVHRSAKHIYAQIISAVDNTVIASASTVNKTLKTSLPSTGGKVAATMVGKLLAERALEQGITKVAFDRSGFQYHGRVKALAESAKETGLQF